MSQEAKDLCIQMGGILFERPHTESEEWESLDRCPSNSFLIKFLTEVRDRNISQMRESVVEGDIGKARACEGYMEAMEDVIDLLSNGISQALSEK